MTIRPVKFNRAVKDTKSRNVNESLLEVNLADILDRSKEDENSDLSMTYLGKINMTHNKN